MSDNISPQILNAYREAEQATQAASSSFALGIRSLPTRQRLAMCAVYAFCREADDIADGDASVEAKRAQLVDLRERLLRCASGDPGSSEPRDIALGDAIRRFGIELDDLTAVIDGVEMDLTISRYRTFEQLRGYCARVASAVGLSVLPILAQGQYLSQREPLREKGEALGLALQLINILRDVRVDYTIDRVYLPQEDLGRFGVSERDLLEDPLPNPARDMLEFQIQRAKIHLIDGKKLFRMLPVRGRLAPALMAAVYEEYLHKISQAVGRASLTITPITTGTKLLLVPKTWIGTRCLPTRSS